MISLALSKVGLLALLLAALLSSCKSGPLPEYWIAGLSLPPGSTVIKRSDSHVKGSDAAPAADTVSGDLLAINFDCPGGWDAVVKHIESCLLPQGYKYTPLPASSGSDTNNMDAERDYYKEGARFHVMLTNLEGYASNPAIKQGMGGGNYQMNIVGQPK